MKIGLLLLPYLLVSPRASFAGPAAVENPVLLVPTFRPLPVRTPILNALRTVASYTPMVGSGIRNPYSGLAPLLDQVAAGQPVAAESLALLRPWVQPIEQELAATNELLEKMTDEEMVNHPLLKQMADIEEHPKETFRDLEPLRNSGASAAQQAERELLNPYYAAKGNTVLLLPKDVLQFPMIMDFLTQLHKTGLFGNFHDNRKIHDEATDIMGLARKIKDRLAPLSDRVAALPPEGVETTASARPEAGHSPQQKGLQRSETGVEALPGHELPDQPGVYEIDGIVYKSAVMRKILERALKAVASDATILITGERGTGKELVADLVHKHSPRREKPMLKLNLASVEEGVATSELFGHEKGAFTGATSKRRGFFQTADGGTLFLDEVGDASQAIQAKLLRAVENGEIRAVGEDTAKQVSVRLIAATNKDLAKEPNFRKDLYDRLNTVRIQLPPLRERAEDILPLARYYLAQFRKDPAMHFSPEAERALLAYSWPGNVRELRSVIQNVVIFTRGNEITPEDLPAEITAVSKTVIPTEAPYPFAGMTLEQIERAHVLWTLRDKKGNKSQTAASLRIERSTLDRKIKSHGLENLVPSPTQQQWVPLSEFRGQEGEYVREVFEAMGRDTEKTAEILGVTRRTVYNLLQKYNIREKD